MPARGSPGRPKRPAPSGRARPTKLPSGRWTVQVPLGADPGGKRLRPRVSGASPEEVREKRDALLARYKAGLLGANPTADRQTVAVLLRTWLENKEGTVAYSTWQRYQSDVERHLIPLLGNVKIGALTPNHLRHAYRQLQAQPTGTTGRASSKALAPRSLWHVHLAIGQALKQAVQDGALARNVATAVSLPSGPPAEARALTVGETKALLEHAPDDWRPLWLLALYTGMRLGELLGLTWADLDLEGATVTVRRALVKAPNNTYVVRPSPKSRAGVRIIPLAPLVVEALRLHRRRQREAQLKAGPAWLGQGGSVFTTRRGLSLSPTNTIRVLKRHAAEAGIAGSLGVHTLRHTFASSLLAAGCPITEVAFLLGHASPATTLKIYSHWVRGAEASTADALQRYYGTGAT